jgi:tetratricopeptide (TPR) repeat protein
LKRLSALVLAGLLASCARPPQAPLPPSEDYVYPAPQRQEASAEQARRLEAAWRKVLAGQTRDAEASYRKVLAERPGSIPAEVGLAYAHLRAGRAADASEGFASVLAKRPDDFPALVGAASAQTRLANPEGTLAYLRRAQAARPDDPGVRKRLADVKLQVTERRVATARSLVGGGRPAEAIEEYRKALDVAPELGALRLELADLLRRQGDVTGATATLAADPLGDRQVLLRLGEVLVEQDDLAAALDVYRRMLTRDPRDAEAQRRAVETREAMELAGMPEEYKRIPSTTRITRADLAALLSVKVTALARVPGGEPEVAVDVSGSWARAHILKTLSLDILTVYPNHTFQPGATVRRGDLARAVARVLDLLRWPAGRSLDVTDMTRNNLFYDAAVRSVAAGLMDLTPAGAFEPWRPVSGREAVDVIEALTRLVGP